MVETLPKDARCLQCGYLLRGLADPVCPECGLTFDPSNPRSYRDPKQSKILRFFDRPPGNCHCKFFIAFTAIVLAERSCPGYWVLMLFVYSLLTLVLGVMTLDWLIRALIRVYRQPRPESGHALLEARHPKRPWLVAPICLLILASALIYPWPAWPRFRLSLRAFERAVQEGNEPRQTQVIGLYLVYRIQRFDSGAVFFDTGSDFMDRGGFLFRPTTQPIRENQISVGSRLTGFWYTVVERF